MIPKPCDTKPTVTVIPAFAGMTTMISFLSRNYVILNKFKLRREHAAANCSGKHDQESMMAHVTTNAAFSGGRIPSAATTG